ncbi:MAG TPA: PPK2 family polyphosphate kinase [Marinagarivorans sp.]
MDFDRFKITGDKKVSLKDYPTDYDGGLSEDDLKEAVKGVSKDIVELQEKLFAEKQQSLLIVLQAMDAAGKDSTIEKLTYSMNAQGCNVHSFKKPCKTELAHDFLWRIHAAAPAKGEINIFNRSHYEDVLIVKAHGWASDKTIEKRYQHINNFEELLSDSGTRVVKFMLNISPDYQLERFKRRLRRPEKHWKFNPADIEERKLWPQYMSAFEQVFEHCSSNAAPWYIVPAENRRFRDYMMASVVKAHLNDLSPKYPKPNFDADRYTADSLE